MSASQAPTAADIASAFRFQAQGCRDTGSALYAQLLDTAAKDVERGGVLARLVEGWRGHPVLDALGLRLLGGIHRMVLAGSAPRVARYYPSAGGVPDATAIWPEFVGLVDERFEEVRAALNERVQTNEVARAAALLPGFLRIAARTGLRLRLLELGSSAGLLQFADRYRYELGPHHWGSEASGVRIQAEWSGPAPDLGAELEVTSRLGCDPNPLDVSDPAVALRLQSFVWPEQVERMALLRAAIGYVRSVRPRIEQTGAARFLARELAQPVHGVATVVFQSVVWWYIPEAERAEIVRLVDEAATRAAPDAPLAWLRLEGATTREAELRLSLWPGGGDALLATAHYHGRWVKWASASS
ncbi:MAG TPA: DUF2332 domain-containing protein [Myxococcota bacterium]|nr:DUF2332 domain-containing protein [Myxococcota bacterium]